MWGGEVLVADLRGYERVGHLIPVAMPGGVAAIREPWRMAAVWLDRAVGRAAVERALADVDPTVRGAVLDLAHAAGDARRPAWAACSTPSPRSWGAGAG